MLHPTSQLIIQPHHHMKFYRIQYLAREGSGSYRGSKVSAGHTLQAAMRRLKYYLKAVMAIDTIEFPGAYTRVARKPGKVPMFCEPEFHERNLRRDYSINFR